MIKIKGRTMNRKGYFALTALIALILGIVLSVNFVNASTQETSGAILSSVSAETTILDEDLKSVYVVIQENDTAWDIQSHLTPEKDVTDVLAQLSLLNQADMSKLQPGTLVMFAIQK